LRVLDANVPDYNINTSIRNMNMENWR